MNRMKLASMTALGAAFVALALAAVPVAEARSLKAQVFLVQVPIPNKLTEKALLSFGRSARQQDPARDDRRRSQGTQVEDGDDRLVQRAGERHGVPGPLL